MEYTRCKDSNKKKTDYVYISNGDQLAFYSRSLFIYTYTST